MYSKESYKEEQEVLRLLHDCRHKDIDRIKLNVNNTWLHEQKKCELCYMIKSKKHRYVTEAIFKDNLRADVIDITIGLIYEVVNSEKEESIIKKINKYPLPIRFIRVNALEPNNL